MFYVSERVGWGTRKNVTLRADLVYEQLKKWIRMTNASLSSV
jgi:hypothetical protein